MHNITSNVMFIFNFVGILLHNIPIIKHIVIWFKKSPLFPFIVSIIISVLLSTLLCFIYVEFKGTNDLDYVKNSVKTANTRLWLENVVDRICEKQKNCTTIGRSFAYHKHKNSGTWCMGHRNMILNKDYLSRKEIYIDDTCKEFLEYNNKSSISYETISNKCHNLSSQCLFDDQKFNHNNRVFVVCKKDIKIVNGISCVALVSDYNIDKHLLELEQFKLNDSLSFFGD